MKLYIVYSKDLEVKVENVGFIDIFDNCLHYVVGGDASVHIVNLNDIEDFFSVSE